MSETLSSKQMEARLANLEKHLRAENDHDLDGIMETYGQKPRVVINKYIFEDLDSIRAFHDTFGFGRHGSFSTLRVREKRRFICDDAIVVEATLSGKHVNIWQGITATGREFEVPACTIYIFDEEGKLADERVYFDNQLIIRQLRN
ncbi:MAG: ester cyclase [Acidobacteria bacterium]|nr:ester cyclase [Acidobacteriota bacterium]